MASRVTPRTADIRNPHNPVIAMSFLRLENLTKRFGDFTAVKDLSLEIKKGEFISLLGPSGCGKTTTLQMIAGLHEPSSGRIFLDGAEITNRKPSQRGLGIVFQSYALFPHMTAFENVSSGTPDARRWSVRSASPSARPTCASAVSSSGWKTCTPTSPRCATARAAAGPSNSCTPRSRTGARSSSPFISR